MERSRKVWYVLVNKDGSPYGETSTSGIHVDTSKDVDDLREAVYDKNASILQGTVPSQLTVYANKIVFKAKGEPLEEDAIINNYGNEKKDALIVVVPSVSALVVPKGADGSAIEASETNKLIREVHDSITKQEKMKQYAHSQMSTKRGKELLDDLKIKVDALPLIPINCEGTQIVEFQWETVKCGLETHSLYEVQNRDSYRKYVEEHLSNVLEKKHLCVLSVDKKKRLLSKKLPGYNIELTGSTDLLILNKDCIDDPTSVSYLTDVKMLIEVKKLVDEKAEYQGMSELIALDLLAATDPVMALVTDLNSNWVFFWFTEKEGDWSSVQRAKIRNPTQAFAVIREVLSQRPETASNFQVPYIKNPLKRRKLTELLPSLAENGGIRECLEQYYDVASSLGPDIGMARAMANQITRSISTFPTYYT